MNNMVDLPLGIYEYLLTVDDWVSTLSARDQPQRYLMKHENDEMHFQIFEQEGREHVTVRDAREMGWITRSYVNPYESVYALHMLNKQSSIERRVGNLLKKRSI